MGFYGIYGVDCWVRKCIWCDVRYWWYYWFKFGSIGKNYFIKVWW